VCDFEVTKTFSFAGYFFQQYAKRRNIPLPISEVANEMRFGFFRRDAKRTVE